MGGTLGNPISEDEQQKINDTIQEVIKMFSIEFSKAYTQAVIAQAKQEVEPETSIEDELKLETAPVPSHILKTGLLVKRGDVNKSSWKQRFFVAYNAKDNFKIDYIEGTNESGKVKGTIYPAGYRAYEFNSDDVTEFGEAGIKLVPWSSRRRTWYIKCPDDAERKEWMSVFENACYKSEPPRDEDACIAEAFDNTIRALRWHYWFWGWYSDAGDEAERLGEFMLDLIDRNIVNAVIDNIVEGPAKSMTVDLIRKTIGSSVKAACSSAWISSASAVRSLSGSIQQSAKDLLGPLFEVQKKFKDKISESISGTINPFLEDKGGKVMKPILMAICKPVIDAYVQSVHGFHTHMSSKISSGEFEKDRFDSSLDSSDWQMDWYSGPLHKSYHICYKIWDSDLAELASLFVGGITPYTVYNMVRDKIKLIAHRAVFTFGKLAKEASGGELASVLSHTVGMMVHDAMLMCRSVLAEVLKAVLDAPLQELVISPATELVSPIQEEIDAIEIPGLNMLVDLTAMLLEVIDNVFSGAVDAIISPTVAEIQTTLEAAGLELGVGKITL